MHIKHKKRMSVNETMENLEFNLTSEEQDKFKNGNCVK